jgi:hypothetical protein
VKVWSFLLLAALCTAPGVGDAKAPVEIIWPRSHSGADNLILELPQGYAGPGLDELDTSQLRATDFPVEDDLLITALWPNLEPPAAYDRALEPHGPIMQTLITARATASYRGQSINALENRFDDHIIFALKNACSTDVQTRSGPVTRALCQDRKKPDDKPGKFGLKRLGIDFKKFTDYAERSRGGMAQRDIFYLRDSAGHLKTAIFCTAEEAQVLVDGSEYDSVGQCEHIFIDSELNALVSVHYRRVYLDQWRQVEAEWRKLLESFIEAPEMKSH